MAARPKANSIRRKRERREGTAPADGLTLNGDTLTLNGVVLTLN